MSAQAAHARKTTLPQAAALSGPRSVSWWAMVLLILNEAVIFVSLLASYFYIRSSSVLWPPQGIKPPGLTLPAIETLLVLAGSLLMQWAYGSVRRGQLGRLRAGLGLASLTYIAFLGIQVYSYTRPGFPPQLQAYSSLFWSITGLYALHILAGLLMSIYLQARAAWGHFGPDRYQAVENVTLYWHFVALVWILIFVSLFLSLYL